MSKYIELLDEKNKIIFFLNGHEVNLYRPSPDCLLIDYLRSPEIALAGPKKPCGQGGCGGCTVILSEWNSQTDQADHRAINACLRPVVALHGMSVTTIEGTGSVRKPNPANLSHAQTSSRQGVAHDAPPPPGLIKAQQQASAKREQVLKSAKDATQSNLCGDGLNIRLRDDMPTAPSEVFAEGMNPVAWQLAMNNGTQCGYCTVGFVMNMSAFISAHPGATKREIEAALDGNLCRCTGYRSILTGMKKFASDWTPADDIDQIQCLPDPDSEAQRPTSDLIIPFPVLARRPPSGANTQSGQQLWLSPTSLADLVALMRAHQSSSMRLVHANTGFGIYKDQYIKDNVLINIGFVPEINESPLINKNHIIVAAGITYTKLIALVERVMSQRGEIPQGPVDQPISSALTRLGAVDFMLRRSAGHIVRNAATLGGNLMLVLSHIAAGTGEPFPSDIATALVAIDATVDAVNIRTNTTTNFPIQDLINACVSDPSLPSALILLRFHMPYGDKPDMLLPQKVALREVNAHSIVNATSRLVMGDDLVIQDAVLTFGGIAPYPWRATQTEAAMRGKILTLADIQTYVAVLHQEAIGKLTSVAPRMVNLPNDGITSEYKIHLVLSFFYKSVINALNTRKAAVPAEIASSGDITWGRWPVSTGKQFYSNQPWKAPVSLPYIKTTAMEQAQGQLRYTHELPMPLKTVNASLVQSKRAVATWSFQWPGMTGSIQTSALRCRLAALFPGFIDIITASNIPDGGINLQGMGADQPIFAPFDKVDYVGQSLALIAADTEHRAATIAQYVSDHCVAYGTITPQPGEPEWWTKPTISLHEAIRRGSVFPDFPKGAPWYGHIWKVIRPGSRFDWTQSDRDPLDQVPDVRHGAVGNTPCMIISNTQTTGGQAHFYMETQAAIAEPMDGRRMMMRPSSQSPMEMHQSTAMVLGAQYNTIEVQIPPVGGGFGGKTEQARFVTAAAAVAARAMKLPTRLILSREQDTAMIGKRHAYYGSYQIAIGTGSEQDPGDQGIIHGLWNRMWGDGGAFYDCSFIVSNCIQTRADNAYTIRNFENQIDVCRTNTAPNTAFRAFGDIQGTLIIENAIDDGAIAIGMRPEDVREKNLYKRGDVTPFGQALSYCYMPEVWSYLKEKSRFEIRYKEIQEYNKNNIWRKRGIAMIPVKYGSGYNATMLEQANAAISIYANDGSVIIHQGGVEMGQGLLTYIRQVAAYTLNIPLDMIEVLGARTAVIPNPTSTGGSTGTPYNAEAVKRLCNQIRTRLIEFANEYRDENGPTACENAGINFWDYPATGWQTEVESYGQTRMIWQNLISLAYKSRIPLTAAFTAVIRGGETQCPALFYKPFQEQPSIPGYTADQGIPGDFNNFAGFTYSGACATVEVDILTGETKILSSDLVYDMGWSLNPALDIGQVEGGFVQGIGYVMTEKLISEEDGDEAGRLNTLNTWSYKPPAASSIPLELNTYLFPRDTVPEVPSDPNGGILSSKEVGEPPLVLAVSVFFAVKSAIRASRIERGLSPFFRFDAPATVQEVSRALEIETTGRREA